MPVHAPVSACARMPPCTWCTSKLAPVSSLCMGPTSCTCAWSCRSGRKGSFLASKWRRAEWLPIRCQRSSPAM
eukprot:10331523-Lingulodinium_polyedra.AAC.1